MVTLTEGKIFIKNGAEITQGAFDAEKASRGTMAYKILSAHNISGSENELKIKFDAMASHDITYVGIIQTARASGLEKFPIPYVLTNCHNSLCAVGGTINEDDHLFGLSAAKKYGGIFVPAHQSVIHSYMREMMTGVGRMILGSDSHTRYGALGTMAMGEGGPELVKQLLGRTYDISRPEVIAVYLHGEVKKGVGPQDVALALIGATFKNGFVKNKVLEFVGPGIASLPQEFRNGIDVMTTESTCLSSIWLTDERTREYYENHGRPDDFKELKPDEVAAYDGMVDIDLSAVENMIALPSHPSHVFTVKDFLSRPKELLSEYCPSLLDHVDGEGRVRAEQGVIAGCSGGIYDNVCAAADILSGGSTGNGEFTLSVYPASQPAYLGLIKDGAAATLMQSGAAFKTAFCGPCFGAGDVPANGSLSLRHTTRNFPNREGSKPGEGQSAFVALCDARTIAATAVNGGILTPATDLDIEYKEHEYKFDITPYENRVYFGFGKADPQAKLRFGPNITDWPEQKELCDDILLGLASVIDDPVTTTDELIPSGETSSYRSNPLRLAEFALSRKDPDYVKSAKEIAVGEIPAFVKDALAKTGVSGKIQTGSAVYAVKPGDGSAREQAASSQRVLGGLANIAKEYATKRYRSNLINWGMLPFTTDEGPEKFARGDYLLVRGIRKALDGGEDNIEGLLIKQDGGNEKITLHLGRLTDDEREILRLGCLINYYRAHA